VFGLVAVGPIAAVQVPGLGDYLNHLARMHVLVSIAHSAALQRFYEVHWTPIPYLAMDAVVPLLAQIFPIYVAGKIFVIACVVLPVAGAACLHYAAYGRIGVVPLAAFLVSTNTLLSLGFLNYLFALGFALMLFAAWVASAAWPRWPRAMIFAPFVLLLYFGHAFACGAYCLAVAGFEIGRAVRAGFRPLRLVAADVMAALAQAIPALVFAKTLDVGSGYVGALQTQYGDLGSKLVALVSPVLFFHDAANLWVLLALILSTAILARRLHVAPAIWPACLPVGLAAAAMPHLLFSTWGMDFRLPLFLVLLLIGAASFPRPGEAGQAAWRGFAVTAMFVLLSIKSVDSWWVLRGLDAQIAETRQVLGAMPRGSRLLIVNVAGRGSGHEEVPNNTIWDMPLTAVIDSDAFVPILFNGLTTIRMRPAFKLNSTPNGLPVTPAKLRAGLHGSVPAGVDPSDGEGGGGRVYWLGWERNFDFVLVQRFGADPGPLPANLVPVAHSRNLDLYRVRAD